MIPEFPLFKKIELSDKHDIEKITSQYPPYSDFNFVSMWCWNTKEQLKISQLYGNLIIYFTDYITDEPFCSFLGNNKITETIRKLHEYCKNNKIKPDLSLIPEHSISELLQEDVKIYEDIDNFDYVYDLNKIQSYTGSQFSQKRNKVKVFLKKINNPIIKILDLKDHNIKKQILTLNEYWYTKKTTKDLNFKIKNELLATERFFSGNFKESLAIGLFQNDKLIGYSIYSILSYCNYATSHFCKADTSYTGIYDYLIQESAKILFSKNCNFLNYEQDLGIPGLRASKKSFASSYLRKYKISPSQ